jgi:meiosis-specific APC/C activator protein AMA1
VPGAEEEYEKHEGRLAKALDFDRAERVFEYVNMNILTSPSTAKCRHTDTSTKTVWKGTEWVLEGSRGSKHTPNKFQAIYLLPGTNFGIRI